MAIAFCYYVAGNGADGQHGRYWMCGWWSQQTNRLTWAVGVAA